MLNPVRQSAWMSKITSDGLTPVWHIACALYCTFAQDALYAVLYNTHMATVSVKGLKVIDLTTSKGGFVTPPR